MSFEVPRVGLAGIIQRKDGAILMGLRTGSHGAETWSLPGGHLDLWEESLEDSIRREIREETGLEVGSIRQGYTTNDLFREEGRHYTTLFMHAGYIGGNPKIMEPNKCREWKWYQKGEIPTNLFLPVKNLIKSGYDIFGGNK